eukprot:TRINITY_DN43108_c0_g1_i1.p1 TRINITY_DN43108_c0_g1~~TRINITY_DN43108_c0_g1_i1.p1  ORF type:complete len:434 (+),score=98.14 TRINITY_DN43108_c0_g1_i1:41-1303(+)
MLGLLSVAAIAIDPQCQAALDQWCNSDVSCLQALPQGVTLYARNSTSQGNDHDYEWRCYAASALSPDKSHYANGTEYCTRGELATQLQGCEMGTSYTEVFVPNENGYPCVRIPAILRTPSGRLLAYAECRNWTGDGCEPVEHTNQTNSNRDLCGKYSDDDGATWSALTTFFRGAMQPSPVWSDKLHAVVMMFNDLQDNVYQAVAADGLTWSQPVKITGIVNAMVGPGVGLQATKHNNRLLFIGHQGAYTYDTVWFSDDGAAYNQSKVSMAKMDEAQLVELPSGIVLANMRNDHITPCKCRATAYSTDGGATFSGLSYDPVLTSPVCQATIITTAGGKVVFANPSSTTSRTNGTLRVGSEAAEAGKVNWESSKLVWPGDYAYSCLTRMASPTEVGLLWETSGPQCSGSGASCRSVFSKFAL